MHKVKAVQNVRLDAPAGGYVWQMVRHYDATTYRTSVYLSPARLLAGRQHCAQLIREARRGLQREMAPFPVLNPPEGCAHYVRLSKLSEDYARQVHGQTLEQLAKRGGLSPQEIVNNYMRMTPEMPFKNIAKLVNSIAY